MNSVTRRDFPRIPYEMKIAYETVKWNADHRDRLEKPLFSHSYNLSVSGIGLHDLPEIDKHTRNKLICGKEKIRLALYLEGEDDPDPVIVFARLVWTDEQETGAVRCGFTFIDITAEQYALFESFVNGRIPVQA